MSHALRDVISQPADQAASLSAAGALFSRAEYHSALHAALVRQFNPVTVVESLIVTDIARHGAQIWHLDDLAFSLETQLTTSVDSAGLLQAHDENSRPTARLAMLAVSERLDAIVRLSLGCSRAMHMGIQQLSQIQRDRHATATSFGACDPRFLTEEQCFAYLIRRFQAGEQPCPRCRTTGPGYWIASRRAWECGHCKTQRGIRAGTVMEHSPLPLAVWFKAIRLLCNYPRIGTAELAQQIAVQRLPTVRSMAKKVQAALATNPELLAGLDELFVVDLNWTSVLK